MDVVKLFSNRYSYSFCPILTKVSTYDLCANIEKIMGQFFKILL